MSSYHWNQRLSVGDPDIDHDHQGLFDLVNELASADKTRGFMADIIVRLEQYANEHFAREEALMRSIGYPEYEQHLEKHRAFVEWLESVKTTYRRAAESPFLINDLVHDFLVEWLVDHIMKEDMKYRDYILSRKSTSGNRREEE